MPGCTLPAPMHCSRSLFPGVASVHAKQARGAMVRHIVTTGAKSIKDLQAFTGRSAFMGPRAGRAGGEGVMYAHMGIRFGAEGSGRAVL
jgi:hypothetical protein